MKTSYVSKNNGLSTEVAPQLPILTRIVDMFIDIDDCGRGPTKSQLARLAKLTAEAYAQVAQGKIQLVSVVRPGAGLRKPAWYGRDERHDPLPAVTPRTYRSGGSRIC